MELQSELLLQAAKAKQETTLDEERQSCIAQATKVNRSAWGDYGESGSGKHHSSNGLEIITPPVLNDIQENNFPLQKKIKSEPKDDYALAEEECARNVSGIASHFPGHFARDEEPWKERINNSASPVFERIPSFAANECHKFTDNCKRCLINQSQSPNLANISLHRRRQIREFEQSGEEPLSNKIRVWKEKRLEKSLVRGKVPPSRVDEEAAFLDLKKSKERLDSEELRQHHMTTRSRQLSSETEAEENGTENGTENGDCNFGYLRYLLTRGHNTSPESTGDENMAEEQRGIAVVLQQDNEQPGVGVVPTACDVVVAAEEAHAQNKQCVPGEKIAKASRKRARHNSTPNFVVQQEQSPEYQENPGLTNKSNGLRDRDKTPENHLTINDDKYHNNNLNNGDFDEASHVVMPDHENQLINVDGPEQYISDIQRPYCNIPDDHQVTHINGVMSLPATRETRYGITLGELKRRTGYPEFLTRVDLIAYVRQSKSAGRALLDKYNISTAGQKSHPTMLSKMCENEARVLGDGINRMNAEYFPWKTLARVASNKVTEEKGNDGRAEQKIKAIQSTRTMLKEIYDLMVENKETPTMMTFEVASHTFGTANILNHLTVFDRLFEEYQSNLIFRQDVRNNNRKL